MQIIHWTNRLAVFLLFGEVDKGELSPGVKGEWDKLIQNMQFPPLRAEGWTWLQNILSLSDPITVAINAIIVLICLVLLVKILICLAPQCKCGQ